MTNLALQDIAIRALPDYFPYPTPEQFASEIESAYERILTEVRNADPTISVRLQDEYDRLCALSDAETGSSLMPKKDDRSIAFTAFSVYITLLLHEFSHTIAYDDRIRLSVSKAIRTLRLDPDQIEETAWKVQRLEPLNW